MNLNTVLFPSLLQVVFHRQHLTFIAVTSLMIKKRQLQYLQFFKFGTYHMHYKIDQHSSLSCKGTSGLLHIMGVKHNDFCCFKGVPYMSPLHCVINWLSFFTFTLKEVITCKNKLVVGN